MPHLLNWDGLVVVLGTDYYDGIVSGVLRAGGEYRHFRALGTRTADDEVFDDRLFVVSPLEAEVAESLREVMHDYEAGSKPLIMGPTGSQADVLERVVRRAEQSQPRTIVRSTDIERVIDDEWIVWPGGGIAGSS